ncbi:MAG TPA: hypothetical protein VFU46_06890 [Gemmatimonadales bacterium]|nr:hypothetical protein [Gemmatimonadales bacterium]
MPSRIVPLWLAALFLAVGALPLSAQRPPALAPVVDSLRPYVEGATGIAFRARPHYGWRTEAEIRRYLDRSFERRNRPGHFEAVALAYHLFGLLPDTADFRRGLSNLYVAQLRGLYDPDTDTLYCRTGLTAGELREVLTHELVHALQDQYLDLAALLEPEMENDRRFAARAVIEGQATFATLRLLAGGRNPVSYTGIWNFITAALRLGEGQSAAFKRAPALLREGLVAPYLFGAQFMSYWQGTAFADSMPYGDLMPSSSEQILHPERYVAGDRPLELRFRDSAGAVAIEDGLGEFEIHVLAAQLSAAPLGGSPPALGWGGDRYRVYRGPGGPALVWYVVWDDAPAADEFRAGTGARLAARRRAGWRGSLERVEVDGRAATRYVWARDAWEGWDALPEVEVAPNSAPRRR